jgi:hypothetical protein
MSLARKPKVSKRCFVIGAYFPDVQGQLRPKRPAHCPDHDASAMCLCRVVFHKWRSRKIGIKYPIASCFCRVHRCYFTVFPPGWTPYGRRCISDVAPNGEDILDKPSGLDAWRSSAFGAGVDASEKRMWPLTRGGARSFERRYGERPYGVRRTQQRHVAGALVLFALRVGMTGERAKVATHLRIDLSLIAETAMRPRDGPHLVAGGAQCVAMLTDLGPASRRVLTGLVRLGREPQYWGDSIIG